ncbi:MAG: hypothetical protein QXP57_07135 [Nitrososphaerota archaeon]
MKRYSLKELRAAGLTERQIEVYNLIAEGVSVTKAAKAPRSI